VNWYEFKKTILSPEEIAEGERAATVMSKILLTKGSRRRNAQRASDMLLVGRVLREGV
jgi:hypothetical protein